MNTNVMTEGQQNYIESLLEQREVPASLRADAERAVRNFGLISVSSASGLIEDLKGCPQRERTISAAAAERSESIAAGTDPRLTW